MTTLPQASARSRWLLPLLATATVVAVVAAVIGGVSAVGAKTGPSVPPVLHLASAAGASLGSPAALPAGASEQGAAKVSNLKGSGWRLAAPLPAGPSFGQVYLMAPAPQTRAFVSNLGRALGMSGQPQHLSGGWYLVSGKTELSVSELGCGHWVYSNHGCLAGPVLDPQTGAGCAVADSAPPVAPAAGAHGAAGAGGVNVPTTTSPPVPPAMPKPVPKNIAAGIAAPILTAVGIDAGAAQVQSSGGQSNVIFSPKVAGRSVLGLESSVSIDSRAVVVDASGWLATSTTGANYPLISAQAAYAQLLAAPQPMMAMALACRVGAGSQGCLPAPDRVVTGATLGLTQAYSTGAAILLVPAWLFHVRGEPTPMAVVAVEPAYLGGPAQPSPGTKPTASSGPAGIGGTSAGTGAPAQVEPAGPASPPPTMPPR
jgi:hypothetical protein